MTIFQPKELLESIYNIDVSRLKDWGIKGLIIDLDDTLVPRDTGILPEEARTWINKMKNSFQLCISSNSFRPYKVKQFAKILGVPSIILAFKPLPFSFFRALAILNTHPKQTAIIGDQLFTDTLGGNLLGMHTIFVKHLSKEIFWPRKVIRWLERLILR